MGELKQLVSIFKGLTLKNALFSHTDVIARLPEAGSGFISANYLFEVPFVNRNAFMKQYNSKNLSLRDLLHMSACSEKVLLSIELWPGYKIPSQSNKMNSPHKIVHQKSAPSPSALDASRSQVHSSLARQSSDSFRNISRDDCFDKEEDISMPLLLSAISLAIDKDLEEHENSKLPGSPRNGHTHGNKALSFADLMHASVASADTQSEEEVSAAASSPQHGSSAAASSSASAAFYSPLVDLSRDELHYQGSPVDDVWKEHVPIRYVRPLNSQAHLHNSSANSSPSRPTAPQRQASGSRPGMPPPFPSQSSDSAYFDDVPVTLHDLNLPLHSVGLTSGGSHPYYPSGATAAAHVGPSRQVSTSSSLPPISPRGSIAGRAGAAASSRASVASSVVNSAVGGGAGGAGGGGADRSGMVDSDLLFQTYYDSSKQPGFVSRMMNRYLEASTVRSMIKKNVEEQYRLKKQQIQRQEKEARKAGREKIRQERLKRLEAKVFNINLKNYTNRRKMERRGLIHQNGPPSNSEFASYDEIGGDADAQTFTQANLAILNAKRDAASGTAVGGGGSTQGFNHINVLYPTPSSSDDSTSETSDESLPPKTTVWGFINSGFSTISAARKHSKDKVKEKQRAQKLKNKSKLEKAKQEIQRIKQRTAEMKRLAKEKAKQKKLEGML